ncbi:MAG TPA: outer membrane lipoprotein carrier protein LolA [Firmicutes bacterium]|nr:outer membrane lipoprotein carrier protein LolA [Bacillota bacterium]
MKKLCVMFALVFTVFLSACGEMSQQDVVDKLSSNLDNAKSYYLTGVMEVESNGQMYQYNVEVAYQQPAYYKVTLKNETTNNEQIILKNDEGVYVLTPALNKQFKFQSDWPLSSSQVYLYQSLVKDILNDAEATFTSEESAYVFETAANYHGNRELVTQKVVFDKKTLTPTEVSVMDAEGTPRISMKFSSFKWDEKFADDYFNTQPTMEYSQSNMGEGVMNLMTGAVYPTNLPDGTKLVNEQVVQTENGDRVIMTFEFDGEKDFTMIQEPVNSTELMVLESMGVTPIVINGTVAAVSETSITWVDGGVEFFVVSETMNQEELISVAQSMTPVYEK